MAVIGVNMKDNAQDLVSLLCFSFVFIQISTPAKLSVLGGWEGGWGGGKTLTYYTIQIKLTLFFFLPWYAPCLAEVSASAW